MTEAMNFFSRNGVMHKLQQTFPGCRDCNSKMTVTKYISPLIHVLAFNDAVFMTDENGILKLQTPIARPMSATISSMPAASGIRGKRPRSAVDRIVKNSLNIETAMNLIILCGMLDNRDTINVIDNKIVSLQVTDKDRALSWRFRYTLMWCMLQILFSQWEDVRVSPLFRHHLCYLYNGIKDFYMSLLFFILHCANGKSDSGLSFEAFHFFYSSHLPFYLMDKPENLTKCHSLSELVMKDLKFNRDSFDKSTVQGDFDKLKRRLSDFWKSHYKPLSDLIHTGWTDQCDYISFFVSPSKAMELSCCVWVQQ